MNNTKKIELLKQSISTKLEMAADLKVEVTGDMRRWKELNNGYNTCLAMLKCYSPAEHARYVNAGDFTHHVNAFVKAQLTTENVR